MSEIQNWIPTAFSENAEGADGDSASSFPSETIPSNTDPPTDDLSFDMISRHKLSLTTSTCSNSHERASPRAGAGVQCFEEDTRSSWSVDSTKNATFKESTVDEDSQNSFSSQKSSLKRRYSDDEAQSGGGGSDFPAENLFEYQWPQDRGEFYFLQEQISDFLGIKSFKRKYPDLARRAVDMDEKQFLRDRGVASETQCDLGLTALRSDDVMELMSKDYPGKYREYIQVLQEKEQRSINEKHREYQSVSVDKSKMADFAKKAVQSAAEYNAHLNQERKEERRACFDLQTHTIHFPVGTMKPKHEQPKMGHYPVALLPGQFQDYYQQYTPEELKYLPVNTVLYGPLQELNSTSQQHASDGSHSDSDDSSMSEDSCSSSQGTHDGSGGSSSGSENNHKSISSPEKTAPLPEPPYTPKVKPNAVCKVCKSGGSKIRDGKVEELVHCSECDNSGHPSCMDLTADVVDILKTYPWQCMDCKTCIHCRDPYDEDKMLFCDKCDRGYHTFCVGLKNLPQGKWVCTRCGICYICGSNQPGPESSKAQWQYDYVKTEGDSNRRQLVVCQPCFKKKH